MNILGIETSCDETAAAIIESTKNNASIVLRSNIVATSLLLHKKTGGIIPETAARQQILYIIPVIQKALKDAKISPGELDAIAVTYGPGLIGSLLIGVETAKTLSFVWNKPLIPVNHLIGHLYANFIKDKTSSIQDLASRIQFPALGLIVSGGHTDLVLIKNHGNIVWLGGTRDDAAGEALDKIGRLLGLSYPAGPVIEQLAQKGNAKAYNFPRPMIDSNDFEFSFSGLKTAVFREVKTIQQLNNLTIADLSASVQQAIIDVLVKKTLNAAKKYNVKSILMGGGVAANQKLRDELLLKSRIQNLESKLFVPSKSLCTDNAAMIATAAFYNNKPVVWNKISANPELYFD